MFKPSRYASPNRLHRSRRDGLGGGCAASVPARVIGGVCAELLVRSGRRSLGAEQRDARVRADERGDIRPGQPSPAQPGGCRSSGDPAERGSVAQPFSAHRSTSPGGLWGGWTHRCLFAALLGGD